MKKQTNKKSTKPKKAEKLKPKDKKPKSKTFTVEEVAKRLQKLEEERPKPPIHRRYKSNDGTIEKLGELLCQNPNGLLILRDELVGLLASWEKQGHEGDRTFYLESWNGCSGFDTDRIGRGTISIPNLCLSLFGGTQPDKLRGLLDLMSDALANDGTLQRFQLLVYPDHQEWEWCDIIPDKKAREKVDGVFDKLSTLDPVAWGAVPADDFNKFPYFSFSHEAQEVFITWSEELHTRKIKNESNMFIVQHLTKYDNLFPALAVILHLVDCAANKTVGPISEAAALQAKAWCEYLETHARRCYGLLADDGAHAALVLSIKLQEKRLKDGFTAHDVLRHGWRHLSKPESVQPALAWLEDKHWLRPIAVPTTAKGGRSTTAYSINPKIKFKEEKNAESMDA